MPREDGNWIQDYATGDNLKINADGSVLSRLYDGNGSSVTKGQTTKANSIPVVIPSDQVLDVQLATPTTINRLFGYAAGINQPSAGTDNPLVLLKNPVSSGKTLYVRFIAYGISVTNVLGTIRLYKNPTITSNGTSKTIVPFGTGSTVMEVYETPTISANGALLSTWVCGQNSLSIVVATEYDIAITPGNNLLVTGNPGSNNRQAELSIRWLEDA